MSVGKQFWHTQDTDAIFNALEAGPNGLTSEEAAKRLERDGLNKLEEGKKRSVLGIFLGQFKDFMIWVLVAAALISGFLGEWVDTGIIAAVVLLNAILGSFQEAKAEAALEALKQMAAPFAKVMRTV